MKFCSTRNSNNLCSLSQAVLLGMADDGGLYFPSEIPHVSREESASFSQKSFAEVSAILFQKFCGDSFSSEQIQNISKSAYSSAHFSDLNIAPVKKLDDNTFLLELFHGPTGAFKDFALQFLPRLMHLAIQKEKSDDLCILVATSGDTGGAALAGFSNVKRTRCVVFFPKGGVSPLQQAQMQNTKGSNILAVETSGDFDILQSLVKNIFADSDFSEEVKKYGSSLSSANSINIGRLLPQIFYVFYAHAQMVKSGEISPHEEIDICVPTGNFGDLFAAFLAKKMGLPLGKLICASNANDTSAEFIESGIFDLRHRKTEKTVSPAMDILRASNLERVLYSATGGDSEKVKTWQNNLLEKSFFSVDAETLEKIQQDFSGETISDAETKEEIQKTFLEDGYLLDPHTAVARRAVRKYRQRFGESRKILLFSTAHYGKFGSTVFSSLFPEKPLPETEEEVLLALSDIAKSPLLPEHFLHVLQGERVHNHFISDNIDCLKDTIRDFLKKN